MHNEFTAIIEKDEEWYIAYCPEIPGANGQGRTIDECRKSLTEAINLILEDRREDSLRGIPPGAIKDVVVIEWSVVLFLGTLGDMAVILSVRGVLIPYGVIHKLGRLKQFQGIQKSLTD